jgi:hypothetical protein
MRDEVAVSGHLIHIGCPKAASNFLRRWFKCHPQLQYLEGGIAGFRNVYEIAAHSVQHDPSILYRVTSCEALATPNRDVGQPSIDYQEISRSAMRKAQAQVADTLASLFTQARILLLTRGFRSLILSAYSQFVRTGGQLDFADYCQHLQTWVAGGDDVWDYNMLVDLYTARFGVENVIVLPYELLGDDPAAFTHVLEQRLGLDHAAVPAERVNPSLSAVDMRWYPRLNRAVFALPLGPRLKRRALSLYLRGSIANRFRIVISMLQHVRPAVPVTADLLPEQLAQSFHGKAERLRGIPHYGKYAREYLF